MTQPHVVVRGLLVIFLLAGLLAASVALTFNGAGAAPVQRLDIASRAPGRTAMELVS